MSQVGVGVWSVGVVFDVCGGAVFLVVDGEDVEEGFYDTSDYAVYACDGG